MSVRISGSNFFVSQRDSSFLVFIAIVDPVDQGSDRTAMPFSPR